MLTLKRNQYAFNSKIIGISSFTPSISPPCHNLKKMANKIKTLAWKIIIIIIILITTKTIIITIIIIILNNNCSSRSSSARLQIIIFFTKKTCLTNTLLWLNNDKTDTGQRTHVKFHFWFIVTYKFVAEK